MLAGDDWDSHNPGRRDMNVQDRRQQIPDPVVTLSSAAHGREVFQLEWFPVRCYDLEENMCSREPDKVQITYHVSCVYWASAEAASTPSRTRDDQSH